MAYKVELDSKALLRRLGKMEGAVKDKGLRSALVGYAGPIKKSMKRYISPVTGDLRRSIGHRVMNKRERSLIGRGAGVSMAVGPTRRVLDRKTGKKSTMWYKMNWLDKGVKRHDIKPSTRKHLKIGGRYAIMAHHPGFSGRRIIDRSLVDSSSASRSP